MDDFIKKMLYLKFVANGSSCWLSNKSNNQEMMNKVNIIKLLSKITSSCLFLFIIMLFAGELAYGADISVKMVALPLIATLEDEVTLTVSVKGSKSASDPEIASLNNFDVVSSGRSSRVEIINGRMNSSIEYTYLLVPKRSGRFRVGPAIVEYKGKVYKSNQLIVDIKKSIAGKTGTRDIFATATINNITPFLYEPVIYTLRFYRRVNLADINLSKPSFDGFSTEGQEEERSYQEEVDGFVYNVSELNYHLIPRKTGGLSIGSSKLEVGVIDQKRQRRSNRSDPFGLFDGFGGFGGFGSGRVTTKRLSTNTVDIKVKPLPQKGKDRYFTNLVGSFSLESSISTDELTVGDSATIQVTIRGKGNIGDAVDAPYESTEKFKLYNDNPVVNQQTGEGGLFGEIKISKAIVPVKPGEITVPPFKYRYFSPQSGKYELLETPSYKIKVSPSSDEELAIASQTAKQNFLQSEDESGNQHKVEIKSIGKDIFPVHKKVPENLDESFDIINVPNGIIVAFGPVLYVGMLLARKKRSIGSSNGVNKKRKMAKKIAEKRLSVLSVDMEPALFYSEIERVIKEYLGERFGFRGMAMSYREILEILQKNKVATDEVEMLLSKLEALNFAGSPAAGNVADLLESAKRVVAETGKVGSL